MLTKELEERVRKVHGDKYDYSKYKFTRMIDSSTIVCPIHGEFQQCLHSHLKGQGCPKCGIESRKSKRTYTQETFIEKARQVHGDKYDYSKVVYVRSNIKVCVVCPKHGDFMIKPNQHLLGQGCRKCYNTRQSEELRKDVNVFIEELRGLYGEYDYSKVVYVNQDTPVVLCCEEHGEFKARPYDLLKRGYYCPECHKVEKVRKRREYFHKRFIENAIGVHGFKYDYSKVEYVDSVTPVTIVCPFHGEFQQKPTYHLSGNGCQQCGTECVVSKDELEMRRFIGGLCGEGNVIYNDRKLLNGFELDVFVPSKNIAIEYDGLYWHNELNKAPSYHIKKTRECMKRGVRLIHVFEDEWLHKKEIVKSRLKNLFHKDEDVIFARKCQMKKIGNRECNSFLEKNHIQGRVSSLYRYGLYYKDELVSVMTFGKRRKALGSSAMEGEYELLRFCNKLGTRVIGGAGKLLKHFEREVKPLKLSSYADKRWSDGGLYRALGFEFVHVSKINYFYVIGDKRMNRFNYRKDKLVKEGYDASKSEHEIMLERKIYRIYDCGTMLFEKKYDHNEDKGTKEK